MNKKLKIATAAVSVVMAGTMALSITACQNGGGGGNGGETNAFVTRLNTEYNLTARVDANNSAWQTANKYWGWLKTGVSAPSENAANLSYEAGTSINIAIGHNSADTGAFYSSITGNVSVPGGYTASTGTIKPAFAAIQDKLNVSFVDKYGGKDHSTSANLGLIKDRNEWGTQVDIATSDLSKAVESAHNNGDILNLGAYLDQMPNFKAFLESNPIVYLSLLQDGMTESGEHKDIYVAPYFDGNDDIERYCIIRQDWVVDLLDNDLAQDGDTYKTACGEEALIKGYMGSTGSYTVKTTLDATGATFDLKKDYDAALAAVKDSNSALGTAYNAIANAAYEGNSGNIVDIMDAALAANNEATGKQLATLYRAYIDVAYKNGSAAAYTKRSDVFNGYNAAWDVDDLVAMLRIVKTNSQNLGLASLSTTGIFPRDNSNDRTPDIIRLVAQLYGERGADSRYEYTYIDKDGKLKDMRQQDSFYTALENFGLFVKEGLVAKYVNGSEQGNVDAGSLKGNCKDKPGTGFMIYDYSQTQTTQMYDVQQEDDYLFGAISTPVSKWDDNGDGTKDTVMRFTESWRSTKTSGLTVAAAVANNQDKLNAVLTFIDYLYSNDGQILSTFGQQSTNGNKNPNGTWYGEEVTNVDIATVAHKVGGQYVVNDDKKGEYFTFDNKLYTGTLYKGKMTPTVTTELYESFVSSEGANATFGARGSFTNYARKVLGATLPMGVKDQSFENQLTAPRAADAATKVSVSLANGTIKHPELIPTDNLWYTVVPTGLPLSDAQSAVLSNPNQSDLRYMTGTPAGKSKAFFSIFHYIIFNGYTGTYTQNTVTVAF